MTRPTKGSILTVKLNNLSVFCTDDNSFLILRAGYTYTDIFLFILNALFSIYLGFQSTQFSGHSEIFSGRLKKKKNSAEICRQISCISIVTATTMAAVCLLDTYWTAKGLQFREVSYSKYYQIKTHFNLLQSRFCLPQHQNRVFLLSINTDGRKACGNLATGYKCNLEYPFYQVENTQI